MLTFTDDEFKRSVQDEVGIKPEWAAEAFGGGRLASALGLGR